MMLPLETERCIGHQTPGTSQIRMECHTCRRRTAPRAEAVVWRGEQIPDGHPCPQRIAEDKS